MPAAAPAESETESYNPVPSMARRILITSPPAAAPTACYPLGGLSITLCPLSYVPAFLCVAYLCAAVVSFQSRNTDPSPSGRTNSLE